MATLFIGMPVYNGERFIADALDSLKKQTFSDWTILISDNHSTDSTQTICQEFCNLDGRIKYIRQTENIGALKNFRFLLERSDSPYFMWAAADDIWDKSFVEACINGLKMNPQTGWAFTNIVNIDSFGRVIREYPSFKSFSHPDPYINLANYILTPEYMGKANLIYGIYKPEISLKKYMLDILSTKENTGFGFDIAFNLGVLCRTRLYIDENVLFNKRLVRSQDNHGEISKIIPSVPYVEGVPRNEDFAVYKQYILAASCDTQFDNFISDLMDYRGKLNRDIEVLISERKKVYTKFKDRLNSFRKLIGFFICDLFGML